MSGGAKLQNHFLSENYLNSSSQLFLNDLTTPLYPSTLSIKDEEINTKDRHKPRIKACFRANSQYRRMSARHSGDDDQCCH